MNIHSTTFLEVPFFDVDSMNIAWHGNYIKYLEIARCELLDKIGYNYIDMEQSGYSWPIIDVRVKYIKPLLFKQKIRIETTLTEFENRLKVDYVIYDDRSNEKLTKAYTIQVAVDIKTQEMCFVSPDALTQKIKELL